MSLCTVWLAPLPIRNAIAQRASPFPVIRGRQDPVPSDQINTSPDPILPFRLHWLGGRSAQDGTPASHYFHGGVTQKLFPSSSLRLLYQVAVSPLALVCLDLPLFMMNYVHGACLVLLFLFFFNFTLVSEGSTNTHWMLSWGVLGPVFFLGLYW